MCAWIMRRTFHIRSRVLQFFPNATFTLKKWSKIPKKNGSLPHFSFFFGFFGFLGGVVFHALFFRFIVLRIFMEFYGFWRCLWILGELIYPKGFSAFGAYKALQSPYSSSSKTGSGMESSMRDSAGR